MTLQQRLTLFFIVIVVLPLAIASLIVQGIVARELDKNTDLILAPALDATVRAYNELSEGVGVDVRHALTPAELEKLLADKPAAGAGNIIARARGSMEDLDFLILLDANDRVVGADVSGGEFLAGFDPPGAREIAEDPDAPGPFVLSSIGVRARQRPMGTLIGGAWLDDRLFGPSQSDLDLSLVLGDQIIASSAGIDAIRSIDGVSTEGRFETEISEPSTASAVELDAGPTLVASIPRTSDWLSTGLLLLALLAVAFLGTGILALWLARLITRPLGELAKSAQAISSGNYDHHIEPRSNDEVGRVALAFNEMTSELRMTMGELRRSRDQLHRAVRRVGETLRATHDMKHILESIVNTSADAIESDAAVLWMFTATRDSLYPAFTRGVSSGELESVRVGDGIVGTVAERATTIRLPSEGGGPPHARGEPDFPTVIAVPLYSQARLMGVLVNYRTNASTPFLASDLDTVKFLAEQGGVAIENVFLHEDAQRLSLTDGLTGVWNRRYFQMQFRQVLAASHRFERPFSVLMIDLDRFKLVNDTYGHQRGDAILVEFSQRVGNALREIDTLARYGGEEFICLLAETPLSGAAVTAEKVCEVIRSEPFGGGVGEEPIRITTSIGVASYPEHGDSFRALIEAADQALYRAKQDGRDLVRTAGSPPLKLAT